MFGMVSRLIEKGINVLSEALEYIVQKSILSIGLGMIN